MSGGHFEYNQYRINDVARDIDTLIKQNDYPPDIMEKFKTASFLVKAAAAMTHRIDWLVSSDDGEDSFRKRWMEDLGELAKHNKTATTKEKAMELLQQATWTSKTTHLREVYTLKGSTPGFPMVFMNFSKEADKFFIVFENRQKGEYDFFQFNADKLRDLFIRSWQGLSNKPTFKKRSKNDKRSDTEKK